MQEKYDFQAIEKKWQKIWQDKNCFAADENGRKPKYYILEMFPYPSGRIHMGHVRNYSIGDVISRYKIKKGFDVLHPMGWDAFGLPAENAAIERGIHPANWTYANIREMRSQLQSLGLGYDWNREVATSRPEYYKWEQLVFLKAFEKGYVYRKKALVNWSEKMQTVLANEQVIDGKDYRYGLPVVQKELTQWFFKTTAFAEELLEGLNELEGKWPERVILEQRARIGKSFGAEVIFPLETPLDDEKDIPIFTTRPDTLYGVTFLSLAPEHPLSQKLIQGTPSEEKAKAFIQKVLAEDKKKRGAEDYEKEGIFTGKYGLHPLTGDRIPIYIANFVLIDYGTGAVMAVPAHDQRDFEFAKKYDLPVKVVIQPENEADLCPSEMQAAYVGDGKQIHSSQFNGLQNRDAIEKIADYLKEKGIGGKTVNYRLRDWCVSRQRYWGAPIPIVYCDNCDLVPSAIEELPVLLPENVVFQAEGGSPIARSKEFVNIKCPKCGKTARRETDTFDTFVESSWYFLRYTSPRSEVAPVDPQKVAFWLPIDQYIGGIEHAVGHLIYARFYHKLMQKLGFFSDRVSSEPFAKLLTQGMVCKETLYTLDEKGQPVWHTENDVENGMSKLNGNPIHVGRSEKMSKSKKNGVDPEEIINRYGSDSARLFTLFAAPPENDLVWKEEGVDGVYRFLNRIWRLAFENCVLIKNIDIGDIKKESLNAKELELKKFIHKTLFAVTEDIEKRYHFNTAIARSMELVNALSKFEIDKTRSESAMLFKEAMIVICHILSLFAPHIAEEIWQEIGMNSLIVSAPWPNVEDAFIQDDTLTIAVQVMGKLRAKIEVPANVSEQEIEELALAQPNVEAHTQGKNIKQVIVVPKKLVNIVLG